MPEPATAGFAGTARHFNGGQSCAGTKLPTQDPLVSAALDPLVQPFGAEDDLGVAQLPVVEDEEQRPGDPLRPGAVGVLPRLFEECLDVQLGVETGAAAA